MSGLSKTGRMLSEVRSFRCDAGMELDIARVYEVERGKVYHLITRGKESRILITRPA